MTRNQVLALGVGAPVLAVDNGVFQPNKNYQFVGTIIKVFTYTVKLWCPEIRDFMYIDVGNVGYITTIFK